MVNVATAGKAYTVRVTGMTCAGCAAGLQRALEQSGLTSSAVVSITTGLANVSCGEDVVPRVLDVIRSRGFGAEVASGGVLYSEVERRQAAAELIWRRRAIWGLSLWLPLEVAHWVLSFSHIHPAWMPWVMAAGSGAVVLGVGAEFLRSALGALRRGGTNMDTLIALGAGTAFVWSAVVLVLRPDLPQYFSEAAGLLAIVSVGHWLEARASAKAGSAVRELLQLQPESCELLRLDGGVLPVRTAEVRPGQRLLIRPGARIPVDGVVEEGQSDVDESIVTGESLPVLRRVGDVVPAGGLNTTGRLVIRTTTGGEATTVARIAAMVQQAQASRAPIQRLADQVSAVFVPLVLGIAAMTTLVGGMQGKLERGVISAVTVLIISCPCALGLATPMAVMVGAGAASRRGILIRNASALEQLGKARLVVFDKTGTLTMGRPELVGFEVEPGFDEQDVLRLAAAAESASEHPIGAAVVRAARERGLEVGMAEEFRALPGQGVAAIVGGRRVSILRDARSTARVLLDDVLAGRLEVEDVVRPDAAVAVQRLRMLGVECAMLTGDRSETAGAVAVQLGIAAEQVIAHASPEEKLARIRGLGSGAVMVGDGLNDAAALAECGVGVALGSGTAAAVEAAAVVIPGDRIEAVADLVQLSRLTLSAIRQNLVFAFVYNVLAIPAAAAGLLGSSGPLWAALAMGFSDLTVVGNSLRLKRRLTVQRLARLSSRN
ncbi:MAG: heavy metal translocating P-type ATPase [Planctomycetaceae bacterium]